MANIGDQIFYSRILIVDDEEANVELLQMMLEVEGYTDVHVTTDPRTVKPSHDESPYELILLDMQMPHLTGIEVMGQVAEAIQGNAMAVLVLTSFTDLETRLTALAAGAKDFVTKPISRVEVLMRIRNLLEIRCLYKERTRQAEILEEQVTIRTKELFERSEQLFDTRLESLRCLGRARPDSRSPFFLSPNRFTDF